MDPKEVILGCDPERIDATIRQLEEQLQLWKTLRALRRVLASNPPPMPRPLAAAVLRQVETRPAAEKVRSRVRGGQRARQIVAALEQGGLTTGQVAEHLGISHSNATYHLTRMRLLKQIHAYEGKWYLQRAPGAEPALACEGAL